MGWSGHTFAGKIIGTRASEPMVMDCPWSSIHSSDLPQFKATVSVTVWPVAYWSHRQGVHAGLDNVHALLQVVWTPDCRRMNLRHSPLGVQAPAPSQVDSLPLASVQVSVSGRGVVGLHWPVVGSHVPAALQAGASHTTPSQRSAAAKLQGQASVYSA
jgi:hypothetical protein